jgi:biopolymer transport protein ExbD
MAMAFTRRKARGPAITLVPMVDVMMILLVFFMVTSTYLDLDQVPAVEQAPEGASAAPAGSPSILMVRLGADGLAVVRGRALDGAAFAAEIAARLAADPATEVVILPSGEAPLQALVSAMDRAAGAGATKVRVIRLEARP